jgi:phosphate transport system substrate-binding protein
VLSDAVTADRGAIGFLGLPYVNKNHVLVIQSSCGLSSAPTRYSIKTEEYPLARRLYLDTLGMPAEPVARELLDVALSEPPQATIADAGFVEQSIEIEDAAEQTRYVENLIAKPATGIGKSVPAEAPGNFSRMLAQLRRTSSCSASRKAAPISTPARCRTSPGSRLSCAPESARANALSLRDWRTATAVGRPSRTLCGARAARRGRAAPPRRQRGGYRRDGVFLFRSRRL